MDSHIRERLAALNRIFYEGFADEFARTRRSWPPGYEHILTYLRPAANVVDLGCGSGRLLAFLSERQWRGYYTGIDGNPRLLEIARAVGYDPQAIHARFVETDLLAPDWLQTASEQPPEVILALAVLHHIPGAEQRAGLLAQCASLLPVDGLLIVTTWQFMNSPRLRRRILPWEDAGIDASAVEENDYLLSWGAGAAGRRYCAFIDPQALDQLARSAGFRDVTTFVSDGLEGDLNHYAVFTKAANGARAGG